MSSPDETNELKNNINDFYLPDEDHIKKLRKIIRAETGFKFTYKDAEEVSYQLIMLYECLARGKSILPERLTHEPGK